MRTKQIERVRALVVIGDTHCGSSVGIMPPRSCLRDGQAVEASPAQRQLWTWWGEFWEFVTRLLHGDPFILVHNGDQIDGAHHNTTQLVTNNLEMQRQMFVTLMRPKVERAAEFYCTCGTMAHAGQSSADEEACARELGAKPDATGNRTRQDIWFELGSELIQIAHHIGTTSSQAYKSSPAMRLMAAMFGAAGEWGFRPPTIMVRNHCHDYIEVKRPNCRVVTCPAWQIKSDWMWGRDTANLPIVGGLVIREGREGVHIREFCRTPKPSDYVKL